MVDLEFNKNDDKMRLLISEMKRKHAEIALGGGKKKIEKQHDKGKLTARERIDYLKDKDLEFLEIMLYTVTICIRNLVGVPQVVLLELLI